MPVDVYNNDTRTGHRLEQSTRLARFNNILFPLVAEMSGIFCTFAHRE